jgi:hypothetical protein
MYTVTGKDEQCFMDRLTYVKSRLNLELATLLHQAGGIYQS